MTPVLLYFIDFLLTDCNQTHHMGVIPLTLKCYCDLRSALADVMWNWQTLMTVFMRLGSRKLIIFNWFWIACSEL